MIESYINEQVKNPTDVVASIVGYGLVLKLVFGNGLVLDFKQPDMLEVTHYSKIQEEIILDFIDFESLNKMFGMCKATQSWIENK